MIKKYLLRKGAAYLLSAAMVLASIGVVPGGGIKTASAAGEVSGLPSITDGLVAYYPFDGTLDNIVSQNGGQAKLHGGAGNETNNTWIKDVVGTGTYSTGKKNQAFEFTGGEPGLDGNNGLELDVKTGKNFTISAWVNTAEKINFQPIFFTNVDGDNYVTAGTFYNEFASGGIINYNKIWTWLDKNTNCSSSLKDLPPNAWTYITLTFDDSGKATLYYNGEILSTNNIENYISGKYENMPIYLGINWWNNSFKGLMDNVAVYNRALSAEDVTKLYKEENINTVPDITSGLTAYYPLDGNLDNIVSENGGVAKLKGGAGTTWANYDVGDATYEAGKKGKAFKFNGGAPDTNGNNGLELDVKTSKNFTISAWVNTAEKIDEQPIFFTNADAFNFIKTATNYNNYASGGTIKYKPQEQEKLTYLDKNTSCSSSLDDLPIGTWTHIVLTFDDSGYAILYYNAEILSQVTVPKKDNAEDTTTPDYISGTYENMPIYLGIDWWFTSFKGLMDDVAVYNRALSPADVAALYTEENTDASSLQLSITAEDNKTVLTNSKYSESNYNLDSVQLSATIESQSLPMQCEWKVNDGANATVDNTGLVKLTKDATDGEKIIVTATNSYGVEGIIELTAKVQVIEVSVESVTLNKETASIEAGSSFTLNATILPSEASETGVTWSSDNTNVATVDQNGVVTALAAGTSTITATSNENPSISASCVVTVTKTETPGGDDEPGTTTDNEIRDESQLGLYRDDMAYRRVSVHDPSIVQDPATKRYYIFGSHCAWAWSDDLENWTPFTNNITEGNGGSAHTIFKDEINWCKKANPNYTVTGNLWAPDIIWDADYKNADGSKGAWLMYMSINGPKWNSTISLLTSDKLDGNWTYVGPVIQSGMSNGFGPTFDYEKVTGGTDVSRYTGSLSGGGNPTIEAHAIDPCVLYDENGDLWMSYGSWSGGISMIKLDKETGRRDYSTTYPDTNNKAGADGFITDPYTGYKIAGGNAVSGEGSYIKKIGSYYYLFLSYGGYAPNEGYNMRVFRSSDIKGPYKDVADNDARTVINRNAGGATGTTGMRLMSYYKWSFADYGYTAQGHNSATVDKDGKAYVIYHNKYNDGTAAHDVRVHQLLTNEDGWILAAPFEYAGETVSQTGYNQSTFTGSYGIMFQKQNIDHAKLQCAEEQKITLEEGTLANGIYTGNITGDYTGTWTSEAGSPYVSLQIGNTTYKGIFCEGTIDETSVQTMTFTAVGNNQECLWGYKVKDPTVAIRMTIDKVIKLPEEAATNITLPSTGAGGSTITWRSNSVAINDNGTIPHLFNEDKKVSMTATITNGGVQFDKVYEFIVTGNNKLSADSDIVLGKFYEDEELDMSALSQGNTPSFANPFHYTNADISNGVSISFDVTRTAISDRLSNIISFNNKLGKLYFTGGSYLGYNDFNGHFIDANLNADFAPGNDYLADNTKVTIRIEIDSNGFAVYKDGTKVYTSSEVIAGTVPGGFSKDANGKNPEKTILEWIKNAPELNFGSGNFWNDLIFKGKIGNVVCAYKQPSINIDGGSSSLSGLYTQDYENVTDIATEWISTSAQDSLSLGSRDEGHGKYMLYEPGSQNSRGTHSYFGDGITWPDNYILEYDMALKAGNNQESQVAVITNNVKYTNNTGNDGIDTGYIFKISSTNSETWIINGDTTKTVNIPESSWVHFTIKGTKDSNTAHLKITNGGTSLFDDDIIATDTGKIKGLYIRAGRYQAVFKADNIIVKEPGVDYTNLTAYNNILKKANQHISAQEANQIYTDESYKAFTDVVTTAEGTVTNTSAQDVVDAQTAAIKTAINGLERKVCTVIVEEAANGTVTGLAADGQYMAGDYIMLKAVPEADYSFAGWYEGDEVIGKYTTYSAMVKGDITITPVFKSGAPVTPAPVPTPTPGSTTAPGVSTAPGVTETPGESTAPGGTTEPGESTAPGGTATPGESTAPGGTAAPGESTAPGGTTEPGESTAPGGTAAPGGSTAPGATTEPGESTAPGATTAPGVSTAPSQKPSGGGSGIGSYIPNLPVTPEQPGTNTGTGASAAPGTQATPGTGTATKAPEPSKAPETQATPEASTAPGTQATPLPGTTSGTKVDEETGAVTETTTKVEENKTTVTEKVTMPDGAESIKETVTEDNGGLTVVTETTTTNNTASVLVTTVTSDGSGNVIDANAVVYTGPSDTESKYSAKTIIPESYLKDIKDAGMDSIDIYVEKATVDIVKNEKIAPKMLIKISVPEVEGVSVGKVIVTKESIESAKGSTKKLVVKIQSKDPSNSYTITIPQSELKKMDKGIDVSVKTGKVSGMGSSNSKKVDKILSSNKVGKNNSYTVTMASNNTKGGIKVTTQSMIPSAKPGDKVYAYAYNKKTGKLEEIPNNERPVIKQGEVAIEGFSGNTYVITDKKLTGSNVVTLLDQAKVSVNKTSVKQGSKTKVKVNLGKGLVAKPSVKSKTPYAKQAAVVTYKSSNPEKVKVSKDGTVTAKGKGKADITIKIKLAGGKVKKVKKTIVVK